MLPPPTRTRTLGCLTLTVMFCLHGPAWGDEQTERIRALEQRLEGSLKLIDRLSARVAELERSLSVSAAALPSPPASGAAPAAAAAGSSDEHTRQIVQLMDDVNQITAGLSQRRDDTGLPVHGFADVGGAWSSGADPVKLRGFNVGTLDLYLSPQFGNRVKSLIELVLEYEEGGGGEVDLERMQLGYSLGDALTVWAGRFHTPFGLWNTSFHHGAQLQTSLSRPRFVEFEDKGGIIPAHSVGLWASGKSRFDSGKITYDAYASNGPRIRERQLNFNAFTDDNASQMLGGTLGYVPSGALEGLTMGVHAFGSTVNAYSSAGAVLNQTRLRMTGAYFGLDTDEWEAMGEYYQFNNADLASGNRHSSRAGFVHVGGTLGLLTPYMRYERAALNQRDAYFASQRVGRSYRRTVVGVRYALHANSSVKLELSSTSEESANLIDDVGGVTLFPASRYRRAAFQYSIAF